VTRRTAAGSALRGPTPGALKPDSGRFLTLKLAADDATHPGTAATILPSQLRVLTSSSKRRG